MSIGDMIDEPGGSVIASVYDHRITDYLPVGDDLALLITVIQVFANFIYDKIMAQNCGRRQVVRHQPSKLIFAGPNPVARS